MKKTFECFPLYLKILVAKEITPAILQYILILLTYSEHLNNNKKDFIDKPLFAIKQGF